MKPSLGATIHYHVSSLPRGGEIDARLATERMKPRHKDTPEYRCHINRYDHRFREILYVGRAVGTLFVGYGLQSGFRQRCRTSSMPKARLKPYAQKTRRQEYRLAPSGAPLPPNPRALRVPLRRAVSVLAVTGCGMIVARLSREVCPWRAELRRHSAELARYGFGSATAAPPLHSPLAVGGYGYHRFLAKSSYEKIEWDIIDKYYRYLS